VPSLVQKCQQYWTYPTAYLARWFSIERTARSLRRFWDIVLRRKFLISFNFEKEESQHNFNIKKTASGKFWAPHSAGPACTGRLARPIVTPLRSSISYEHNKRIFKCGMSHFRNYLNCEIAWHTALSDAQYLKLNLLLRAGICSSTVHMPKYLQISWYVSL